MSSRPLQLQPSHLMEQAGPTGPPVPAKETAVMKQHVDRHPSTGSWACAWSWRLKDEQHMVLVLSEIMSYSGKVNKTWR